MKLIEQEDLVTRAADKGDQITQAVRDANIGCVKEVRGAGLMIGIQLDRPAKDVFLKGFEQGLLLCYAGEDILRLAPPLVTDDALLEKGTAVLLDLLRG